MLHHLTQAIIVLLFLLPRTSASEDKPLWEYGLGVGTIKYAHYPASDQYAELSLPFPTFQYRGEVLRADDQDGGRAYLFKKDNWSLQFSGGGRVPLNSSKNLAREGMENIPLVINAGPQIVYSEDYVWEFKISTFPSVKVDDKSLTSNGGVAKVHVLYNWNQASNDSIFSELNFGGTWALSSTFASKEYNATYYEVSAKDATPSRPAYRATEGFLENQISYFQRVTSGKLSIYLGASYSDFTISANRQSPLHKADYNMEYAMGLTYILGESTRRSVPLEETDGIINKQIQKRKDKLIRFE